MSSKRTRSSQSSALKSNTKPTTISSKNPAFEQVLIDNDIYPINPGNKPDNWEEIQDRLAQLRASLLPSRFSDGAFETFLMKNEEVVTKAQIMSEVFPMFMGQTDIPSGYNQIFNNLEPLGANISSPQPNFFNGSRTAEIWPKVQNDLMQYIIPSSEQYCLALPNFITEVKGP